jgi:hypothetical protein
MLNCDKYEALIMRYSDHDLGGHEQEELDQHLGSCSNCRLLFSQLSGILDTLENTKPPEPEPHLEKLVMDQIMRSPVKPVNNGQYKSVKLIYGLFAGIAALFLWTISLTVQDSGFSGLILAGRLHLDALSGFMLDLEIIYRIVASLFPSEISSLFLGVQFIFILAAFMLSLAALRAVFSGQTGGHLDVS